MQSAALDNLPPAPEGSPPHFVQRARDALEPARSAATPVTVKSPDPLTVQVTLNPRDARVVCEMADEDYRTPAQQVGWIVAQWLKLHAVTRGGGSAEQRSPQQSNGHAMQSTPVPGDGTAQPSAPPPPVAPGLVPVYHVGDGSAGSGCGRVGLFFRRQIGEGDVIAPGDAVRLDGVPVTSGGLVCGHCGGGFTMGPRNWRAGSEEG